MKDKSTDKNDSFIEKILDHKALILIIFGLVIRIFMLLYYYYTHAIDPLKSWGDVGINFAGTVHYPPLTMILLNLIRLFSFGSVEIFAFWSFLFEVIVVVLFYYVLKSFDLKNKGYIFGLFLINPFLFLNNVFSYVNCGYHITDSFFFIFLLLSLYFYPRDEKWSRYLFYIFLALSASAKIFTLPFIALFFIKFLLEKNWNEMKNLLIWTVPVMFLFLVTPIFFIENYIGLYFLWNEVGEVTLPLYIRIIPALVIVGVYLIFRLKKTELIEIIFVSILITASFLFFTRQYLRYFQALLFIIILSPKVFFEFRLNLGFVKRKIVFDNNLLVFYSSFILVAGSFLIIIYLL